MSNEVRSKVQKLRFALGQIRRQVDTALEETGALDSVLDPQHSVWKCDACGYTKHFTKPASLVACDSCPKCKGTAFSPVEK